MRPVTRQRRLPEAPARDRPGLVGRLDTRGRPAPDALARATSTRSRQAGYRYSELGPFGYLPTDPGVVRDEYAKRGLTLTGGTVFVALHKGTDALEQAKADCDAEMAIIGPLGARHLVILPEGYTDLDGNLTAQPDPDRRRVGRPHDGHVRARPVRRRRARRRARVPHPRGQPRRARRRRSSASSTAPTPRPSTCASTPGTSRTAAPTTCKLIRDYPEPHPATSTSSRSTRRSGRASRDEQLGFAPAVRLGVDGRAAARRARTCRPCWRRSGRSTATCSASSSRTCTRATPDVPLPDRDAHPRVLRGLRARRRAAARRPRPTASQEGVA